MPVVELVDSQILEAISNYCRIQSSLLSCVIDRFPNAGRLNSIHSLKEIPARGSLVFSGYEWIFIKHGSGISFIGPGKIEVNAHSNIKTHPDCIDGWRISIYLDSIGVKSLSWHGVIFDSEYRSVERLLEAMHLDGALQLEESCYTLVLS